MTKEPLTPAQILSEVCGHQNAFEVGDWVGGRQENVGRVIGFEPSGDVRVRWDDGLEYSYPKLFLHLTGAPAEDMEEEVAGPGPGPGLKFDDGKDPWHLLPWEEVHDVVKVLAHGANKYGPNNWQNVEPKSRYWAAAWRHWYARFIKGEVNDPESGLPHLAHAVCSLLFLAWKDRNQTKSEQ